MGAVADGEGVVQPGLSDEVHRLDRRAVLSGRSEHEVCHYRFGVHIVGGRQRDGLDLSEAVSDSDEIIDDRDPECQVASVGGQIGAAGQVGEHRGNGVGGGCRQVGGHLVGADRAGGEPAGSEWDLSQTAVGGRCEVEAGHRRGLGRTAGEHGEVVIGLVDDDSGVGLDLQTARPGIRHAAGCRLDQLGAGLQRGAVVVIEVGGGERAVGVVLDPHHHGAAGLNHRVGRRGRPQCHGTVGQVGIGVEVGKGVVAEVEGGVRGVVDLDELITVSAVDIGRVRRNLGDLQNRRVGTGLHGGGSIRRRWSRSIRRCRRGSIRRRRRRGGGRSGSVGRRRRGSRRWGRLGPRACGIGRLRRHGSRRRGLLRGPDRCHIGAVLGGNGKVRRGILVDIGGGIERLRGDGSVCVDQTNPAVAGVRHSCLAADLHDRHGIADGVVAAEVASVNRLVLGAVVPSPALYCSQNATEDRAGITVSAGMVSGTTSLASVLLGTQ